MAASDAAVWCDIADVTGRLGDAQNAKGYADPQVADKIVDAQDYLRPYFSGALASGEVAGWTSKSLTPKAVVRLTAMLAAAYILQDFGGQSFEDELSKAGSLWSQVRLAIKGIQDGSFQLVNSAGTAVSGADLVPTSSILNKDPTFSMGNAGDDSEGTLDEF